MPSKSGCSAISVQTKKGVLIWIDHEWVDKTKIPPVGVGGNAAHAHTHFSPLTVGGEGSSCGGDGSPLSGGISVPAACSRERRKALTAPHPGHFVTDGGHTTTLGQAEGLAHRTHLQHVSGDGKEVIYVHDHLQS